MFFKKAAKVIVNAIKSAQEENSLKELIGNSVSGENPVLAMLIIGYAVYYADEKAGSDLVKFVEKHFKCSAPRHQISRYSNHLDRVYADRDFLLGIIYDLCEKPFDNNSRINVISWSIFIADNERKKSILTILEQELKRQIKMATYTIVDECYNVHLVKSLKELARRCYQSNASVHVEMVGLPAGSELAGKRIHIENEKKLVSFLTKLYADGSPTVNLFETEEDTDWFYKIQKH